MKKKYLSFLITLFSLVSVLGQNCNVPTNIVVNTINPTTVSVSWTPGGTESQWEVAVTTPGSPAPQNGTGTLTTTNPFTLSALTPCTSYQVWVKAICDANDFSNWSAPVTFVVNNTLAFSSIQMQPANCTSGGTITTVVTGGSGNYSCSLYSSTTLISNNTSGVFENLVAGNYFVTVTDLQTMCTLNSNVINVGTTNTLSCNAMLSGNMITVNASGGTPPYEYSINGGPYQTSSTFTVLLSGNHVYEVIDALGCTCSGMITINNGLNVTIISTLSTPPTLVANVSSGTSPYTYQWSLNGLPIAGATTDSINAVNFGCYSVVVTDNYSQIGLAQFCVQPNQIIANNDVITLNSSSTNTITSSNSVLTNDFLNSIPVNSSNVVISPVSIPAGFQLNTNGLVSILPGIPAGVYTIMYTICETNSPSNCATATATVTVLGNGLLLKAFVDSNNNGIKEANELYFTNGQFSVDLNNSGTPSFIQSTTGTHFINESNSTNLYDFNFVVNPAYTAQYSFTGSSFNDISYNTTTSGVQEFNFPVVELPFNDLSAIIMQYGAPPRPGFNYTNRIMYSNQGNQVIPSGSITFTKDNMVSIVNVSQAGITSNASGFTYNFTNLLPNEYRYIDVTMSVPTIPTVALGDNLNNTVTSTTSVTESSLSNNNYIISQTIVGSYDPNDKTESHGGKIVYETFNPNEYLNYTIQFENTGTYEATNVRINDILDSKLDETSVRTISSSHPYTLSRSGNGLNWHFNGINLPPSVPNSSTGKGYVNFQVKLKPGYSVGDIIPNSANIYFDFNPAIVTNVYNTEIITSLGINEFNNQYFTFYPNPVSDTATIVASGNNTIEKVVINDVLGKVVYESKALNENQLKISLDSLNKGIYFMKVTLTSQQQQQIKIVKQ